VSAGNIRSVELMLLHACFLVPSKLEAAVLEYFRHTVYFISLWIKSLERAEDNIKI
jgi:hypothetical protein